MTEVYPFLNVLLMWTLEPRLCRLITFLHTPGKEDDWKMTVTKLDCSMVSVTSGSISTKIPGLECSLAAE